MNYLQVYESLIKSRLSLQESRQYEKKNSNAYYEQHHILPKCLGGTNVKSNLILLTAKEHFIAHWLLWKGHKTRQLGHAFYMMTVKSKTHSDNRKIIPTKLYEKLRTELSENVKLIRRTTPHPSHLRKGGMHWNFGRKTPKEVVANQIRSRSGEKHWSFGKARKSEDCIKISKSLSGRKLSPDHKAKSLVGLEKARNQAAKINRKFWKAHTNKDVWQIADKIYQEWILNYKPGSRKLGYIVAKLGKDNGYNFETGIRHESLLRYFRDIGDPKHDPDWNKDFT